MEAQTQMLAALEARERRRNERRDFFRAVGAAAAVTGGLALAARSELAEAQTAPTDADVLNFALNLEYLEAQFYSFAANGVPLPANLTSGTGTPGTVIGGAAVDFSGDPAVGQYAREIAADERFGLDRYGTHRALVRALRARDAATAERLAVEDAAGGLDALRARAR